MSESNQAHLLEKLLADLTVNGWELGYGNTDKTSDFHTVYYVDPELKLKRIVKVNKNAFVSHTNSLSGTIDELATYIVDTLGAQPSQRCDEKILANYIQLTREYEQWMHSSESVRAHLHFLIIHYRKHDLVRPVVFPSHTPIATVDEVEAIVDDYLRLDQMRHPSWF